MLLPWLRWICFWATALQLRPSSLTSRNGRETLIGTATRRATQLATHDGRMAASKRQETGGAAA